MKMLLGTVFKGCQLISWLRAVVALVAGSLTLVFVLGVYIRMSTQPKEEQSAYAGHHRRFTRSLSGSLACVYWDCLSH